MKLLKTAGTIFLATLIPVVSALAAKHPNIVFVFSDDHATQAISAYGFEIGKVAPTPNLDRIAAEGMRFDRCMVGNSICGPDGTFVAAHAEIKETSIIVSSPEISSPVAVRYSWRNDPQVNLFGRNGLPVAPFRTDR